jgi:hypothetical protein
MGGFALSKLEFIDGRAVVEASELGLRPGQCAASIDVPQAGVFSLKQIDRSPDGEVVGFVYRCGRLSLTVVND